MWHSGTKKNIIYIEIKTKSKAYHKQLFWYYVDAFRHNKDCKIIYLTIDGSPPPETSLYISSRMDPTQFPKIDSDHELIKDLEKKEDSSETRYYVKDKYIKTLTFKSLCSEVLSKSDNPHIATYVRAWEKHHYSIK